MTLRKATRLTCMTLAATALLSLTGVTSAVVAGAQPVAEITPASAVDTNSSYREFSINNWGYDDRTLVVSNVFATDGNGTNTRVGPFLPSDEYPAVGTRLDPHDSLTFKVSRTVLGNHGQSVLIYDPNNTKDTVQVWMKAQVFSAYSEARSTRGVVMGYGDHVVICANDPLGS